jgi:hypothetical protein
MAERRAINVDLAALVREDGSFRTMLAWGDPVDVLEQTTTRVKVRTTDYVTQPDGSIKPQDGYGYLKRKASVPGQGSFETTAAPDAVPVMRVDFVDVQQGDAAVIETPAGKVITLDGGDNQLFARYLAGRFRGTTADAPKEIDAMVVSHGDADHFAGLAQIQASEELSDSQAYKRLFVHPKRVFHNGLVKRPSSVPELASFGQTATVGDQVIITELADDLLAVPDTSMNTYFRAWKKALRVWNDRSGPIAIPISADWTGFARLIRRRRPRIAQSIARARRLVLPSTRRRRRRTRQSTAWPELRHPQPKRSTCAPSSFATRRRASWRTHATTSATIR